MSTGWRPPGAEVPETSPEDPRVGQLLVRRAGPGGDPLPGSPPPLDAAPRAAILGFPCDEGVRRNGGRPGAAQGPGEVRRALYGMTPDAGGGSEAFRRLLGRTVDVGDLEVTGDVSRDQEALGETVAGYLEVGTFVAVLGGGHETAFGHFLGYVEAGRPVELVNLDAHPDVRPWEEGRPHSGSPFRQALLHPSGICRGYSVAGLGRHCTAPTHREFLAEHGCSWTWREDVDRAALRTLFDGLAGRTAMVSMDLDAVDRAYAPGVSAPATGGMDPATWLTAAELAGASPAVASADVVELAPRLDRDGATASLAALTLWHLLRGLASRG